jgi:hypothetical protein
MALAPGAQLAVELQSDQNGAPSGQKIAAASVNLLQAGQQQWVVASLQAPVTLPGAPFWILLSATKGSVLWLLQSGGNPARLFGNTNGIRNETARFDGFEAMARVLPPAAPAASQTGSQIAAPQSLPIQAHLSIGAASSPGAPQEDGSRLFNVVSLINAFLAAARAQSPAVTTATIPLVFTTGAAGTITVYPPHVAYDVS